MLDVVIIAVVLIILFHIFIYHEYNWPSYSKMIDKIPGPKGIFYFGSTLRFYNLKPEDMMADFGKDFRQWGSTFRHWYSGVAVVFVSDINDIQTLLTSKHQNQKGMMYKNILPWLGTGLLTSSGDKWHTMRKIITPTFHFSILQGFVQVFNKNVKTMLDLLDKQQHKDECDLHKFVTRCALDTICETAMGTELNSQKSSADNDYVKAIFRIGQIVVERMFSPIFFTNHNFAMSPTGWEHSRLLKCLHGFTSTIMKEKKAVFLKHRAEIPSEVVQGDADNNNIYFKKRATFLEMLLEKQAMHSLTDKDIREEVDTFMFEGHDTTSAAISWSLFELGHHPAVQAKVFEELDRIFGNSDREPTYNDLKQMHYLKRVIQETLRLYPSVPLISRKFNVDMKLCNYTIPAHTEIVFAIYYIHRNPQVFPEPLKFDPDRFLQEEVEKRHAFAYIPFSAGARNCVGQKFAMLEELVMLSSIIRKFHIESLDARESVKVIPEMILRPHKKLRWRISRRHC